MNSFYLGINVLFFQGWKSKDYPLLQFIFLKWQFIDYFFFTLNYPIIFVIQIKRSTDEIYIFDHANADALNPTMDPCFKGTFFLY